MGIKYAKVLNAKNAVDINTKLNEAVNAGWIPQGGVSVAVDDDDLYYAVLMVKGDDDGSDN